MDWLTKWSLLIHIKRSFVYEILTSRGLIGTLKTVVWSRCFNVFNSSVFDVACMYCFPEADFDIKKYLFYVIDPTYFPW